MKNLIIYFSSTGNSLLAARYFAQHLENCTIVPIIKVDANMEIGDADTNIGFIFPAFFFSIPRFFSQGIEKLSLNKDAYFYGIVTCNGFYGNSGHQLKTLLEGKGCKLSFFKVLKMPGNYIVEYAPPKDETIDKKIAVAEKKLPEIVSMINNRDTEAIRNKFPIISKMFFNFMYDKQDKWHKKFYTNSKCTSCGLCEKICQFDNIENIDGRPRWKNHCEHCVACIQLCPSKAIEYGKRTKRRARYINPKISAKDLIQIHKQG